MRRRLIVFTAILLLLVNLFCVSGTYAWFTSANNVGDGQFDAGLVLYKPEGAFINVAYTLDSTGSQVPTGELVVPGSELIDPLHPLTLTNQSNVNTKLKVEISYEFRPRPDAASSSAGEASSAQQASSNSAPSSTQPESPSYTEKMDDLFTFEMGEGWIFTTSPTEVDKKDRKRIYYYGETPGQTEQDQGKVILPSELTQPFNVIKAMELAKSYGGFQLDEQLFITVRFYARQSEYLDDWSTIENYVIGV